MLLAHKVEIRPNAAQADYINRACGIRRHAYNQLLAHFSQPGVKWSKRAAHEHFMRVIRPAYPWYGEVSARASRNAVDDLDNAFKHFFRRVKLGQKPGYPKFKKKDIGDSFAMRERRKFSVSGRLLRIEKMPGRIRMRQRLRFSGDTKQVTISKQAGKFYASILVDTEDYLRLDERLEKVNVGSSQTFTNGVYAPPAAGAVVGVDFGISSLATLSTGEVIPANQKLKANLRRLKRRNRNLSRKKAGSNRRAKAKLALAKLHKRISDQRKAVLHETSDMLTKRFDAIVIEDLNVKGMVRNRCLARAISDAGFGMLRSMIEYKAKLRGNVVVPANRFYPSSKTCSECGSVKADLTLADRIFCCDDCGHVMNRDLNAAINLQRLHTFEADAKRTQETSKTAPAALSLTA